MTEPEPMMHKRDAAKVVVGLSGGVDSSVCALLLQQQGYDVLPLFMKNWEEDDRAGYCAAAKDLADAEAVCVKLGLQLRTVNFSSEYWDDVFTNFLDEYRAGRTPNPDILCNKMIKFRAFLDYALHLGADFIATGHYAQTARDGERYLLLKGADDTKDQSYFLYTLGQLELQHTLFPLGTLTKATVRKLALESGLATHDKKDSTGICFIGERPFKQFLGRYLEPTPGKIQTPEGEVIGEHDGLMYYTLGQRQGLGLGGRRGGNGKPWYVVAKDINRNALVVAQGREHPLLYSPALTASDIHWTAAEPPQFPLCCCAKIRYRQSDQACTLLRNGRDTYHVAFERPQWAVTPGQSVVFYNDEQCLGGGIIGSTCADRDHTSANPNQTTSRPD